MCDSSWAILKVKQSMPHLSEENFHIGDPEDSLGDSESEFEAIFHDRLNGEDGIMVMGVVVKMAS